MSWSVGNLLHCLGEDVVENMQESHLGLNVIHPSRTFRLRKALAYPLHTF